MLEHLPDDNHAEKIEKMVTMTVAAAKGIVPVGQVALPMAQIARGNLAPPEIRDFAQVLSRILKGERDPVRLVEDYLRSLPKSSGIPWIKLKRRYLKLTMSLPSLSLLSN